MSTGYECSPDAQPGSRMLCTRTFDRSRVKTLLISSTGIARLRRRSRAASDAAGTYSSATAAACDGRVPDPREQFALRSRNRRERVGGTIVGPVFDQAADRVAASRRRQRGLRSMLEPEPTEQCAQTGDASDREPCEPARDPRKASGLCKLLCIVKNPAAAASSGFAGNEAPPSRCAQSLEAG